MTPEYTTLLVGCGPTGQEWAKKQTPPAHCLDCDPHLAPSPFLLVGDILQTDLPPESVGALFADLVLNVVAPPNFSFETYSANPLQMLQHSGLSPQTQARLLTLPLVDQLIQLHTTFRSLALWEMLRLIHVGGKIVIIDTPEVIAWLTNPDNSQSLFENQGWSVSLQRGVLTEDDRQRSATRHVATGRAQKVTIIKLEAQLLPGESPTGRGWY